MLTQIRHIQKGTLIVVTAIIVLAFTFLYSDFDFVRGTLGTQNCVFKVYGKCYRAKEAQKIRKTMALAQSLGMYEYYFDMFGRNRLDGDDTEMLMNSIIFRKEAAKLGVVPSFEEIQSEIPNLDLFKRNPNFNKTNLENFLAGNGFTLGEFQDLVGDYLAWKKVRALVTAGIDPLQTEIDQLYNQEYQRYEAVVVDINREDFVDKVKVTDEQIKTYFDNNTENLNTETKRGFIAVHFIPGELPADATNEQKAIAEKNFKKSVSETFSKLAKNPAEFEKTANASQNNVTTDQVKVEKLEPFAIDNAPEFFNEKEDIVRELFSPALTENEVSKAFSQPDGSYLAFQVTKVEEPKPLTLEQAKEQITTVLKNEQSDQLASDAAAEARTKIQDALKAGKSAEEAAKASGFPTRKIPNFSRSEPPAEVEDASSIVLAVNGVNEGEVSEARPQPNGDGYLLAVVDKIFLYEDSSAIGRKVMLESRLNRNTQAGLFDAWFHQRQNEADVSRVGPALPPAAAGDESDESNS